MHRIPVRNLIAFGALFLSSLPVAEAQTGGDKRLLLKTSIKSDAKPVKEVLQELADKHKLPIEFDPSLDEEASGVMPFTLSAEGISLGSAIELACRSDNLRYSIEKGKLVFRTISADNKNMVVRQYALAPLGPIGDVPTFLDGLQRVTSGFWSDLDGEGGEFTAVTPQALSINQTRTVHAELQNLFEGLAAATAGRARPASVQERAEQLIATKLRAMSQVSATEGEKPVAEVLDQLLKKSGVPYWVDLTALQDEGIDWAKATFTPEAGKMPINARLDAICESLKLSWRIGDDVVQITSRQKADEQMVVRIYDCRRLVGPNRSPDSLASEIANNKELGAWASDESEGGEIMVMNTLLVVRQTHASHAKLAKVLK